MNEICAISATILAGQIARRERSAVEVVEAYLAQITHVNPQINALVASAADQAHQQARAADAVIAAGSPIGPLHGVPFTVKDWIDVAGLPCTGADPQYRTRIPAADASAVARLRAAGAIVLGKTNALVENAVYGRTNNPYNVAYSPAGSSSGEAALIAAGGSPLGLGSDSGGSIRQPAHNCGIAGLKPTTGLVPLTGHFPFISTLNDPRTTIGPMARFVEDLALVLPIISGPDGRDPSAIPVPVRDWRAVQVAGLRVAWYTHHDGATPGAATATTCQEVASALASQGAHVVEAVPPRIAEAIELTHQYWQRPESTSPDTWIPDGPASLGSEEVEAHLFAWDRFRRALLAWMDAYDLILTPAAAHPAAPHGEPDGGIPYTLPYSLVGWPAAVVRAGTAPDGMPIGVQLVARPWRDDVALAAAACVERLSGGWQAPALAAG